MKYIRSKDGIYEYVRTTRRGNFVCKERRKDSPYLYHPVSKQDFINQSDTIEELCDEFVVENPEKDIHIKCCDLQGAFDWVEDQEIPIGIKHFDEKRDLISGEHDWNVYGAIWTDKGLIYVAKMNKDGELELL